jgi:hypothetical protein
MNYVGSHVPPAVAFLNFQTLREAVLALTRIFSQTGIYREGFSINH